MAIIVTGKVSKSLVGFSTLYFAYFLSRAPGLVSCTFALSEACPTTGGPKVSLCSS